MAVSGDYAIAGAVHDGPGSASIFQRSGVAWSQVAKFVDPAGAASDQFGHSVAIDGEWAIVGNVWHNEVGSRSGSARVYHRAGSVWDYVQTLTASDGGAWHEFGYSVAVKGDCAVVTALKDEYAGAPGAAYVFQYIGGLWSQVAMLTASNNTPGDRFGIFMAMSGDSISVGACWDSTKASHAGAVYVFDRPAGGWTDMTETAKIFAPDGAASDLFGYSVSMDGNDVIAGAPNDDDRGTDSGSAYVFHRTGTAWALAAKLTAADGSAGDSFGSRGAVGISGGYAIIGAGADDAMGAYSGAAYTFQLVGSAWVQTDKLTASDGVAGDGFGAAAAIDGGCAVVGSGYNDAMGTNSGAAYVYEAIISLDIDIKPGSDPNSVNLRSQGVLPVAALTTDEFDASGIDASSLALGDPESGASAAPERWAFEDVDGDGDTDTILHFSVPELVAAGALGEGSTTLVLTGSTLDGKQIVGSDSVRIVPGSTKGGGKGK